MTIDELEDTLPNGFHDAQLVGFCVDFATATCILEIDADCDDPDPHVYRRVKVKLSGLSFFVVELPDARIPLSFDGSLATSGFVTEEKMLANFEAYRSRVPQGSFFYSFFLNHENCHIHLAAKEAEFTNKE